jgi:hypothetical protein
VQVQNGDVVFLPRASQTIPGRPIVGVVFLTRDLAAVRHCLDAAHISPAARVETAEYESVIVGPRGTFGLWMEFREVRGAGGSAAGARERR